MEIMKVFSSYDDYGYEDERLYSVLLSEEELALFSEGKLRTGDKVGIWVNKHLATKKDREAVIEGYGEGKWHKYGKQAAKRWAANGAIAGGAAGYYMGGARGAAIGSAAGGAGLAAGGYLGSRTKGGIRNIMSKHSTSVAEENKRIADRARVANGDMSKEEYIERHGKK